MTTRAFFKVCLVLIFLTTIVEKHIPRILKKFPLRSILMSILCQFHAQRPLWIWNYSPLPFLKKGNNKTTKDWQCGASQSGREPFSPSIPPQLHDAMKQSKPFCHSCCGANPMWDNVTNFCGECYSMLRPKSCFLCFKGPLSCHLGLKAQSTNWSLASSQIGLREFFVFILNSTLPFLSDPSPIIGNACQWLTDWLLISKLDWCDSGMWRWQLKTCWSCYCCWGWWWETCRQQFGADLEGELWS